MFFNEKQEKETKKDKTSQTRILGVCTFFMQKMKKAYFNQRLESAASKVVELYNSLSLSLSHSTLALNCITWKMLTIFKISSRDILPDQTFVILMYS